MPGWCGQFSRDIWEHGTFAPCKTDTVAGSVFLVAAAAVLGAQCYRMQTVVRRRHAPLSTPTAKQLGSSCAYGLIALLHASWLAYLAIGTSADFAPFEVAFEVVLLVIWSAAMVRHLNIQLNVMLFRDLSRVGAEFHCMPPCRH